MEMQIVFTILLVVAVTAESLSSHELVDASIIHKKTRGKLGMYGGETSSINEHPYLVSLVKNGVFHCAGTILNEKWIITDADCSKSLTASVTIVVASSNDGLSGTTYTVKQIVTHPNYGENHLDYDYACIQIDGTFEWSLMVQPASLPTKEIDDYTWLQVAGYGKTSKGRSSANGELLTGELQWLNSDVCESMLSFLSSLTTWTERLGCAYNAGKTTLCKGDFGDALVLNNTIYGIFVSGVTKNFCSINAFPNIFADVFPVIEWIDETISES